MGNNQIKEVPVYLFTGFLGSGKTGFIQETLEDPGFDEGGNTIILLCEEGEREFETEKFISKKVKIIPVEDEKTITPEYLDEIQKLTKCDRVIVEYNGMWLLDTLYTSLPENWTVYQEMTFFDSQTILTFNNNMRNIVVDKMKSSETVVFKNFRGGMDKMPSHKLVRTINRRSTTIYEYGPNKVEGEESM
ncbi:MAG: hypothetical protein MJ171_07430, partial [Clostridia bacterium]|nr:hypothetical protein [Clostridia bacterium]